MTRARSPLGPEQLAKRWFIIVALGVLAVASALFILRSLPKPPSGNIDSFGRSTTTQQRANPTE